LMPGVKSVVAQPTGSWFAIGWNPSRQTITDRSHGFSTSSKGHWGFRAARGLLERPVYRQFFTAGLTVFDSVTGGRESNHANLAARFEVRNLLREIGLIEDYAGLDDEAFHELQLAMAEVNNVTIG